MCDSTLLRAVPAVIGVTVSAVDRLTHGMGNGPKGTAKKADDGVCLVIVGLVLADSRSVTIHLSLRPASFGYRMPNSL